MNAQNFLRRAEMTTSKFQPAGKHVVITGGASGIGLEVGRCLADRGAASLSIFDISQSALSAASDKLKALSSDTKIHTYQVDVTKYSEVSGCLQSARLDPKVQYQSEAEKCPK